MKSSFYLKHDLDARDDEKMRALLMNKGAVGYGIYWMLAEDLYKSGGRLARDYKALAWAYHVPEQEVKSVAENFALFYRSHGKIACRRVDRDLDSRREASEKASAAGKASAVQRALNVRSTHSQPGEERRGEERKGEDRTAAPSAADLSKLVDKSVDKLAGKLLSDEQLLETQLPFSFGDIPQGRRIIDIPPDCARAILERASKLGLSLRRALEMRIRLKQNELHPQLRSA